MKSILNIRHPFRTFRSALAIAATVASCLSCPDARAASPFTVEAEKSPDKPGAVVFTFGIPPHHKLYADQIEVAGADGKPLAVVERPAPAIKPDPFTGEETSIYESTFSAVYRLPDGAAADKITVSWLGCNETLCFPPDSKTFEFTATPATGSPSTPSTSAPVAAPPGGAPPAWKDLLAGFDVAKTGSGYMKADEFLAFLDTKSEPPADSKASGLERGWLVTLLLILLGGVALNLTPCVLPMIPINLAIIGAGAQAGTRGRGFLLGGVYGLGMALAYGALGLVVVLTGAKFGSLNASAVFNGVIAVVFVVLALAMFDVFTIDLTRFQSGGPSSGSQRNRIALAFGMGVLAALLAGACVAPVVISVLLLAGQLYGQGQAAALLLPFLLGLGMGLPWPFAGAGLSFLPKPGRWMNYVKYAFGVMILVFAGYYGKLAFDLSRPSAGTAESSVARLEEALKTAARENRPVFIDFWATWCKNCLAMEKSTFKDPAVEARLKDFEVVKFQAEKPNAEPAKSVLDTFEAQGLPTYVILRPKAK